MLPGVRAGFALALLRVALADRVADIPVALANAAALLAAIAKLRQIDLRQWDRDILAALPTDHLALRHIFAQVFLNFAPHDLAEAVQITFDSPDRHSFTFGRLWVIGNRL